MARKGTLSRQTRLNWLIDAAVFGGALLAALSGIYFLYLPSGGYQGGRNPMYGVTILFSRATWSDIHMWSGIIMIAAVAVHLSIHWRWVKMMGKRVGNAACGRGLCLSRGGKINLAVDIVVAVSFLITAVSGVYFLYFPHQHTAETHWLWSGTTWDLLHTWAGVVLISAAVVHFAIHWRWVKNVTKRFFGPVFVPAEA
jgi:cytochrome b subunit of formate dehydrogenase